MINDRRQNDGNRKRLDEIHASYKRFAKLAGIAIGIQAVFFIISLGVIGHLLKDDIHNSHYIRGIALKADFKAEQNRTIAALAKEKVCSQSSNRRAACRALFDRLAESISDRQRYKLACAILNQMRGSVARMLRRETKCP